MYAGSGFRYLLGSVAAADGDRDPAIPLTRYYTAKGTPPGYWAGTGLAAFQEPAIAEGATVTEQQLEMLIGHGVHPTTGVPLGRRYPVYHPLAQRIAERVDRLDATVTGQARQDAIDHIEAEERRKDTRQACAAYDYTFSVPKTVSVLWGLADATTQQMIAQAHHDAVSAVLDLMERQVAATRKGVTKPATAQDSGGAIVQADVAGLAATCYDHFDSRTTDPQLHTHVVISNKVLTVDDGQWRSLDGRPMFAATVAISEYYNAILADTLTARLGVTWEPRVKGRDRNPIWELAAIPQELADLFSTRTNDIEAEKDRLIDLYVQRHGHQPSAQTVIGLRQQATMTTRPPKTVHSLAELTEQWREQAAPILGVEPTGWTRSALDQAQTEPPVLLRADDITPDMIGTLAAQVVAAVSERRATWRRWNLYAEATRQTMGWRFADPADREAITAQITQAAEQASLRLTPAALAAPASLTRPDGTSRLRPANHAMFTSQAMLDAEDRLLALSQDADAPTANPGVVSLNRDRRVPALSLDQREAVARVATSGLALDLLIGPAGAGKTTALSALRAAWEHQHGEGSVVGLAPSATAAQVLGDELGIPTENTAKWLTDHDHKNLNFQAGQLVIIDEASLAGTFTLDRITALAAQAGAKALLVGDPNQLQAVDAGGAFNLLASARPDTPTLVDIHRFSADWEKTATIQLRAGDAGVIADYAGNGRIHGGDTDAMQQQAYQAWLADINQGRRSILIADNQATVTALNTQARHDRIVARQVQPDHEVTLGDGTRASAGDLVITRHNDRRLQAGTTGWVRNGDRWAVTKVHPDGAITVRRDGYNRGATVILPAQYVADSVDLGYAITAFRSQGVTVDTSHVVVTDHTPRENLYVAMTRGKHGNTAYVATDGPEAEQHTKAGVETVTAEQVLAHVLATSGADPSAHQTQADEHQHWLSLAQLIPECEQIISDARAIHDAMPADQRLAELKALATEKSNTHRRTIAGLVALPPWPLPPEHEAAIRSRRQAIQQRIADLSKAALAERPAWLADLGPYPTDQVCQARWNQKLALVLAYRDTYGVNDRIRAVGEQASDLSQRVRQITARQVLRDGQPHTPKVEQSSTLTRTASVIGL